MQSLQVDKGAIPHVTRWRVLGRNIPTRKGALPHAAAEPTRCIGRLGKDFGSGHFSFRIDSTAIASEQDYSKSEIRDLYVRRFKKDVKDQLAKNFPERSEIAIAADASSLEESAFEILDDLKLPSINKKGKAGMLFKTTLLKATLSSPMACLETVVKRIKKVEKNSDSPTQDKDIAELEKFKSVLEQVTASDFSKYQQLLSVIKGNSKDEFAWKGKDSKDRIVIFTERLSTMRFLKENLAKNLSLKKEAIATLDGGMSDVDLMKILENFGNEKSR